MTDDRRPTGSTHDSISEFWHLIEPPHLGRRELLRDLHRGINPLLAQHSAFGADQTILDISSDLGESLRTALAQVGGKSTVIGVDPIHSALKGIRGQLSNTELAWFVCAEFDVLPFPPQCFDRVISRFGLNFVNDPEKCIRQIYNLLRPEGILTMVTFERVSGSSLIDILLRTLKNYSNTSPRYVERLFRFDDYEELHQILKGAGFHGIRMFPRTVTRHLNVSSSSWTVEAALFFGHYFAALSKQDRLKIVKDLRERLEPLRQKDHYVLEDNLRLVTAMR